MKKALGILLLTPLLLTGCAGETVLEEPTQTESPCEYSYTQEEIRYSEEGGAYSFRLTMDCTEEAHGKYFF